MHSDQDQGVAAGEVQRELAEVAAVLCDEVSLDAEPVQATPAAPVRQGDEAVAPRVGDSTAEDQDISPAWSYLRGATAEPPPKPRSSDARASPSGSGVAMAKHMEQVVTLIAFLLERSARRTAKGGPCGPDHRPFCRMLSPPTASADDGFAATVRTFHNKGSIQP